MARIFASKDPKLSLREERNMKRARRIAAEGMVLLENKGGLPLSKSIKEIALYGNGARFTVKGGTGSGDVNSRMTVNVEQGLEAAGFTVTTKAWLDRYDREVKAARKAYIDHIRNIADGDMGAATMALMNHPFWAPPTVPVTEEDIKASQTDTAIYILARNSGEGRDRRTVPGDYELSEGEKEALRMLAAGYQTLIVVLNVGGVIDTRFFRQTENIHALLLMSQAGNIGGLALADILTGAVTPSGHLTSTWAENYEDYPGADTFSHKNGDVDDEYYREGIYVGYRYFDTFHIKPAYPFGYGKSYTEFSVVTEKVWVEDGRISVKAAVTNTGNIWPGKEVVQIYYSAPAGKLKKPYQELAAFAKTRKLVPGEKEVLTISWPVTEMASYDAEQASWLLEAGAYEIRVGTHSRNAKTEAVVLLDQTIITESLSNRLPLDCVMEEISCDENESISCDENKGISCSENESISCGENKGISCDENEGISCGGRKGEGVPGAARTLITLDAAQILKKQELREEPSDADRRTVRRGNTARTGNTDRKIKLTDVMAGEASLDELADQLTVEELAELCVGTARGGLGGDSVVGAASLVCPGAAGDTTSALAEDREIMNMILADGPAGLRLSRYFAADKDNNILPGTMEAAFPGIEEVMGKTGGQELPEGAAKYYQYCTAIPVAVLLAQTWDIGLIEEAGDIVGEEMEELGVTLWLAPGMNIHRNPLCGRNFEYYSEDPLVSGICAAADTLGVQKHPGVGTTIKHFAFNNQEDNRMHVNAHVSERAAREIYLKGFEIAVKAAQPMAIMTSYNLVNGLHTANSCDLLTAIARKEWGFAGIVMTDWGTTGSIEMEPEKRFKYGASSAAGCIRAGNDLIMPGSAQDIEDITKSVGAAQGEVPCPITLEELRACGKRMLSVIMQSAAYPGAVPYKTPREGLESYILIKR